MECCGPLRRLLAAQGREPAALEEEPRHLAVEAASADATAYRFPLQEADAWLAHLRRRGYVVVAQALTPAETAEAEALLWADLEQTAAADSWLRREDPNTWDDERNFSTTGLIARITQLAGAWHVRGAPGIKQAFARIWETEELITSMDCVLAWRPWWGEGKSSWRPQTEGLHLDQNPFSKPGLHCVQGMVPLRPVTRETGGLQVVPNSHTDEAKASQKKEYPHLECRGDWCPLYRDEDDALLLLAEPGDLILWDSRTIHGGVVGTGPPTDGSVQLGDEALARLSVAVAMTPRSWASRQVLQLRKQGFRRGENFNHSPHEVGSTGTVRTLVRRGFQPIQLSEAQAALL